MEVKVFWVSLLTFFELMEMFSNEIVVMVYNFINSLKLIKLYI